mgnify:FL=1
MITPQTKHPNLAKIIGISKLYFKREDLHPHGSHKGRSIPIMIDKKIALGKTDFAISSTGNAALSAVKYIQEKNQKKNTNEKPLSLSVFIGKNINPEKKKKLLAEIHDKNITIIESTRPLQESLKTDKTSLRQSNDPDALVGYETLARELSEIPDLKDIFIGTYEPFRNL